MPCLVVACVVIAAIHLFHQRDAVSQKLLLCHKTQLQDNSFTSCHRGMVILGGECDG